MAKTKTSQSDILSRVQDLGAEALSKLGDLPGGQKLMEMANDSRSRLDDLQKRVRGLEELERRIAKLEKQVASTAKPAARKTATTRKTARKPSTPKKPTA